MARTLYKRNKNNSIQVWKIWTEGALIFTEHGKLGGKMQTSEKEAVGKNVGKKNETSDVEQARLEMISMWKKQKDKGYFETAEEAQSEVVFLPMLAAKLSEKAKAKLEFPLFVQPKLDGVRCLAHWEGNRIKLTSRGGKEYNVPHISKELEAIIPEGRVFDGEIYIHGLIRQDINALVKKHRTEEYAGTGYSSLDLEYWIYDSFVVENLSSPFSTRWYETKRLFDKYKKHLLRIKRTLTLQATDRGHIESFHAVFMRHKYEGTIVRLAMGEYELGHRSRALLKYKDFQDEEFEVIGYEEGVGKFVGCVVWVCKTKEEKEFNVVPKGTLEQKKEWFDNGDEYIGEEITVKFQSLSKDGIPEFPVGIGFRLKRDK